MGKQNKELFDNIQKLDSNDYQGRTKEQVQSSEFGAFISVIGLLLTIIGVAIYNAVQWQPKNK